MSFSQLRSAWLLGVACLLPVRGAAPQSLTWITPDQPVLALRAPHPLQAQSSSGLPVHFRVLDGPAVILGDELTVTNVDIVSVIAEQPGDGRWAPTSSIRSFNEYRVDLEQEPGPGLRFNNRILDLVPAGDRVLAMEQTGAFHILQVPEGGPVVEVQAYPYRGRIQALAASETHAFASYAGRRLDVVDLSGPGQPTSVGGVDLGMEAITLSLQGGLLFAGGVEGLAVLNARDVTRIQVMSRYRVAFDPPSGSGVRQIVPAGNRLYLLVGAGLQIVDISDPANPRWIGGYSRPLVTHVFALPNQVAGVADIDGVTLLDVSNPMRVRELGHHPFRNGRRLSGNLWVAGDLLYLADAYGGIEVVSLRQPSSPRVLGDHVEWNRNSPSTLASLWVSRSGGRILAPGLDPALKLLRSSRQIPQTLQWDLPASDRLSFGQAHRLGARASSGLAVEWSVVAGPGAIEQGTLRLNGADPVVVVARQPGTAEIAPVEIRRTFNPTHIQPQRLGTAPLDGFATGLVVTNHHAFVMIPDQGVRIFDLRNPSSPRQVATVDGIQTFSSFAFSGKLLSVQGPSPSGGQELTILDVHDPTRPVIRSRTPIGSGVSGIGALGSFLLMFGNAQEIPVVDLADPGNPRVVANISWPGNTDKVAVDGAIAVSASGPSVWEVTDPLNALPLGRLTPSEFLTVGEFRPSNGLVLSAANRGREARHTRLEVHRVSRSRGVERLGMGPILEGYGWQVAVHGTWAFLTHSKGNSDWERAILDLRDPVQPRLAGWLSGAHLLAPQDDLLVATTFDQDLVTYSWREARVQSLQWKQPPGDILQPGVNHPLAATADSGLPMAFTVASGPAEIHDGVLAVTDAAPRQSVFVRAIQDGDAGHFHAESLRIFNRVSVDLELLGEVEIPGLAAAVSVSGGYACVAGSGGPVSWVDVRDPRSPRVAASVPAGVGFQDVVIAGNFACAANSNGTLAILDLRNPDAPTLASTLELGASASRVTVDGNRAYVVVRGGIQVADISDPFQPRLLGSHHTPDREPAVGLLARDGILYVAESSYGLTVLDVRNPATPVVLGTQVSVSGSGALALDGSILWFEGQSGGLHAADVSDPAHPRWDVHSDLPPPSHHPGLKSIALQDGIMLCSGPGGLDAVETGHRFSVLSSGSHPVTPGMVQGVVMRGDLAYVTASGRGLLVFRVRRGIRAAVGPLDIPSRGEAGEALPLPDRNRDGLPLQYDVVSGGAQIRGATLFLNDPGEVLLQAAVIPSDRYFPTESRLPIAVLPLLLRGRVGEAGEPPRIEWRSPSDRLESSPQLGGPWTPVPDARSPFRPSGDDAVRFFRVVRP